MNPYEDLEPVREPPHNLHAEQAVLGSLMDDNALWDSVCDQLTADDFYRREHRNIFTAIQALAAEWVPFDVVTLADYLERFENIDEVGGLSYLGTILAETPTAKNIKAYAKIVREASTKRRLIAFAADQQAAGFAQDGTDAKTLLEDAQAKLGALVDRDAPAVGGFVSAKEGLTELVAEIDRRFTLGTGMVGVSTGFTDIDQVTRGLEPESLIIVAARPSMGKTTLAMQIAGHVAGLGVGPVAVFSLEMSLVSLWARLASSAGRINHDHLRTGALSDDEWPRLTSAVNCLSQIDIKIDDRSGVTISDIASRSRRLKKERGGLALVVIDYLQQIAFGRGRVENQNIAIGNITKQLKSLAKELKVPVMLLSQLNRDCEKRPNKRPQMSDLRDSGSIEQDADMIAFIYRDEVYDKESKDKGTAEIILSKNRNGQTGMTRLAFAGQFCRFDNFTPAHDNDGSERWPN